MGSSGAVSSWTNADLAGCLCRSIRDRIVSFLAMVVDLFGFVWTGRPGVGWFGLVQFVWNDLHRVGSSWRVSAMASREMTERDDA